ncbi:MAG: hypothetical protein L7H18_01075 [Candidatus Nealsonbacteria bacterium DGGOD1a]|nr:MAG: hypothetical protein L7H18_01075 [Candidatus Nealsonbacteria bacterium DGGOD1a]
MDILFWYVFVSIFAVGMIVGSFLNCLIWRLHNNESARGGLTLQLLFAQLKYRQ